MEQIIPVWQVAVMFLILQTGLFSWRLQREIEVGGEGKEQWFPVADWVNVLSIGVNITGVFILPTIFSKLQCPAFAAKCLGMAVLLLFFYPFLIVGHYELYKPRKKPDLPYFPKAERVIFGIMTFIVTIYGVFLCIHVAGLLFCILFILRVLVH